MGHLLRLKCAQSPLNLRILSSTSVPFTLTMVQLPNLALIHTKWITLLKSKHHFDFFRTVLCCRIGGGAAGGRAILLLSDAGQNRTQAQHSGHQHTASKIPLMYPFSGNCAALVSVSTFLCLWAIYIFPGLVHLFPCSWIGRPMLEIYNSLADIYECRNWETEQYNSGSEITVSFRGKHKWEPDIYIEFSQALHLQCRETTLLSLSSG